MYSGMRKHPWLASFLFAVLAFILLTARKVFEYATPPDKPKDCDFIFPPQVDYSKPTTLRITSPSKELVISQKNGYINDASCLNKTPIYGVVKVTSVEDVSR